MPLHAQITHESDRAETSGAAASDSFELGDAATPGADGASPDTVTIELNFKAFADDVPPTEHARRVAAYSDPTVQDFADQALELAALRAELKRLTRDHDALQNAVRLRDTRLQTLRDELAAARAQVRNSAHRSSEAHELSSTLELPALPIAAAAPASPPKHAQPARLAPGRQLVPVDHDGDAVLLSRDIITIGRTKQSDVCIPSRAVSRDHARLLVSPGSVTVVDMDSANGCFVNDEPVKRQKLRDGDVLRIGDRSYRFVNASAAAV